jgi:E3 ubiquitin-protein ligase ZNF598
MAAANTAISTEDSSAPSQRRPDGHRVGRGRGGRGRGGPNASQMTSDGHSRRQEGTGATRGRGGSRAAMSNHGRTSSTTITASDLQTHFGQQKASGGRTGPETGVIDQVTSVEPDSEAEVCFICASPVVHNSVAPCNHRTCHICALRMRALYKTKDCAHCRVSFCPLLFYSTMQTLILCNRRLKHNMLSSRMTL